MNSIKELLMNSNSDKQSAHRYGFIYELLFAKIYAEKQDALNILEIGVSKFGDGSLSAWSKSDMVKRAVGLDVNDYTGELDDGMAFYKDNAYDLLTIESLHENEDELFDIIIDDGTHRAADQKFFLDNYTDLLSEHGILICEDVFDLNLINLFGKDEYSFVVDGWANRGLQVRGYDDPNMYAHNERLIIKSCNSKINERHVHESKPHIARLPTVKAKTYKRDSNELAISIPLFHSDLDTQNTNFDVDRFKNIHVKGAVVAGLSMIKNTDLESRGVPLWFHIEDKVWDHALPVFKEFSIPESWCKKITVPPGKELEHKINKTNFGKKYIGLLDDDLDPDILMVLDSDFFTCTSGGKFRIYDKLTSPLLKRQPAMTYFHIDQFEYHNWVNFCLLASGLPGKLLYEEEPSVLEARAFERLGFKKEVDESLKANSKVQRFRAENYLITFPRGHETRDYVVENITSCYSSPYIFAMWAEFNQLFVPLHNILNIPIYDWEEDYMKAEYGHNCFAHIRVKSHRNKLMSNPSLVHNYIDTFLENVLRHV